MWGGGRVVDWRWKGWRGGGLLDGLKGLRGWGGEWGDELRWGKGSCERIWKADRHAQWWKRVYDIVVVGNAVPAALSPSVPVAVQRSLASSKD